MASCSRVNYQCDVCTPDIRSNGEEYNMSELLYDILRNGCMLVLLVVIMLAIYVSWFGND